MDTTKSFEGVISEITLIFEEALSGVKSTTLLYTIPEKLLHKEDRSLGHSLLDAENPANKMATQTVIKTMLRKPFFLNRPLCNVANFSPSLEFFISIVNKHCHFCQADRPGSTLFHRQRYFLQLLPIYSLRSCILFRKRLINHTLRTSCW